MTDHVIKTIECSHCEPLAPARALIRRVRKRQLYVFVDEVLLSPELTTTVPSISAVDISTHNVSSEVSLRPEDIIVYDNKLNYNLKHRNPVDFVSFYSSRDLDKSFHTPKQEVSLLFPEKVT